MVIYKGEFILGYTTWKTNGYRGWWRQWSLKSTEPTVPPQARIRDRIT